MTSTSLRYLRAWRCRLLLPFWRQRRATWEKWEHKARKYKGYQKLAYLHPNRFTPDQSRVQSLYDDRDRYFILRLVKLNAHHDFGITGIPNDTAEELVKRLEERGRVWISAERPLPGTLEGYRLKLDPTDIHHALAYADMYIGDSQSMTVEAALLGTPSIRVSDFVGRIGVLEELESKYELTVGLLPGDDEKLFAAVQKLLSTPNLKAQWAARRERLLEDKIDVTAYFTWFITNYPKSAEVVRDDPDYPSRFK